MDWFGIAATVALALPLAASATLSRNPDSLFPIPDPRFPTPYSLSPKPYSHPHPLHVTYGRLAIETNRVALRIRMFRDDLEKALALSSGRPKVVARGAPEIDSLFGAYIGGRVTLVADGGPLAGKVAGSGVEGDMRWYLIQYRTAKPVKTLALSDRVFFELFTDQQNLLKVVDMASGEESSLYFVPGEPGPVTLTFSR